MLSCIVLLGSFKRQLRMEETFQVVGNQLHSLPEDGAPIDGTIVHCPEVGAGGVGPGVVRCVPCRACFTGTRGGGSRGWGWHRDT